MNTKEGVSSSRRYWAMFGISAVLLIVPLFVKQYILFMLALACIYSILGSCMRLSLNTGQLNFGVPAFMAIGAYCSSLVAKNLGVPPLLAFLAAGILAALVGGMIGFPSLRVSGAYFLLLIWGFIEIVRVIALMWTPLTNGALGVLDVPPFGIGRLEFTGVLHYYFVLLCSGLILFVLYRIEVRRLGLTFKSIKQEERLAESLGIDTYKFKMISFMISCFFAGLAGSLYVHTVGMVSPEVFGFVLVVNIAVYNFFGGLGHFVGPIVGAGILTIMTEFFRGLQTYERITYSVAVILVILFLPEGVISLPQKLYRVIESRMLKRAS